MELLIIVIIMMVLSSLSRYLRKRAGKETSFDPRPYVAPSRPSRKDAPGDQGLNKREWQKSQPSWRPEPEETPYARERSGGEGYAASIRHETGRQVAAGSRPGETKKPQAFQEPSQAPARARPAAAKDNGAAGRETTAMKKQLRDLIKNEGLPLGIVISEILGPPRGKKTYRMRKM